MLVMRATKDPTHPIGELVSTQQLIGLDHLALAVDPHRLYRVQPRALLGKEADDDAHPQAGLSDLAIVGCCYPVFNELTLVPASIVPDQEKRLFAFCCEFVAAPPKKVRGDSAYGPPLYESQPHSLLPSSSCVGGLRAHQHPISSQSLRIGVVFDGRLLDEAQRL